MWLQNVLSELDKIDKDLFLAINKGSNNAFFDHVMPFCRESKNWILLYFGMIVLAVIQEKKKVWIWVVFALLTVLATDQISSHLIKPLIQRLRPCNNPEFLTEVRLLLPHCSGGYSFTSSHATNHFGIALFFMITLKTTLRNFRYLFIPWALIICFAQVYVGVHYPFDVIFGGLLGTFLGIIITKIYKYVLLKKINT